MNIKKIIFSILILGLMAAGIGFYYFNKGVEGLENVESDYELSADALFNAFDTNESEALLNYEGKVISVTGKVARIKSTDSTTNITIYAENAMAGGINCSFNKVISTIKKGDEVSIKGRCQGYLMDVILNNCTTD